MMAELLDRAVQVRHFAPTEERQDRAQCMDCDWSCGWDLDWRMVMRYADVHSVLDHQLEYKIQVITTRESRHIIEAQS